MVRRLPFRDAVLRKASHERDGVCVSPDEIKLQNVHISTLDNFV